MGGNEGYGLLESHHTKEPTVLSEKKIKAAKPRERRYRIRDGQVPGLYLDVYPSGAKAWTLRVVVRRKDGKRGRRRDCGLGGYPFVSLEMARDKAIEYGRLARQGTDPVQVTTALTVPTFADEAQAFLKSYAHNWKASSPREGQFRTLLATHVFPHIGERYVDEISPADIRQVIDPLWRKGHHAQAKHVAQMIGQVLNFAVDEEHRTTDRVSPTKAAMQNYQRRTEVEHHPAVPWQNVPDAIKAIGAYATKPVVHDAHAFLVLTAARPGEVRDMEWDQVDWDAKVWNCPPSIMKNGRPHRVPLTPEAVAILECRSKVAKGGYVFFLEGKVKLGDHVLRDTMRRVALQSSTPGKLASPHGYRNSFTDWARAQSVSEDVRKRAISHVNEDETDRAYARSDLLEQRRPVMEKWANHVMGTAPENNAKRQARQAIRSPALAKIRRDVQARERAMSRMRAGGRLG